MSIHSSILNEYCFSHSSDTIDFIHEHERMIALESHDPTQSSDYIQGRFLSFISKLVRPQHILEIGTYMGYSTAALAEGLRSDGIIDTIEKNKSLRDKLESVLMSYSFKEQVRVHYGSAIDILPSLDLSSYDLVFIDAAKKEYLQYFNMILNFAKSGTVLIIDNVLWKNEVLQPNKKGIAKSLDEFNKVIAQDDRVTNFILPLRDGLNIITVR